MHNKKRIGVKKYEERAEAEKNYHDKVFSSKIEKNYYTLGFTSIIFNNMMEKMGDIQDKKVLEFGCGGGWLTKILASKGAEIWAFDISMEAVKRTKDLIEFHNLRDKVHINQMGGEKLIYDDNMFDLVVGNAVLHHVDLSDCLREIRRVLRPHGKAYFMEPLGHNPFLNLYRATTPNLRSRDEMPLRFEQFPIIEKVFSRFEHKEYYLTSIFALIFHFLKMNKLMIRSRDMLFRLDSAVLRAFPSLRKYCWYTLLKFEK